MVVLDTTKVQIFKQITTILILMPLLLCCFRYHKGTDFQANHNSVSLVSLVLIVVLDTTKVQIFKQITTIGMSAIYADRLFQIPQRYRFSSKSQLTDIKLDDTYCCFRYHKGTDFQANHNLLLLMLQRSLVVLDTTKVQIFKQITTSLTSLLTSLTLFQIPQRYRFSSKSQLLITPYVKRKCCFRYHKGTDFQANHNALPCSLLTPAVVLDTTKVQIFKQITTCSVYFLPASKLFQIPQRYRFSSKSQHVPQAGDAWRCCFRYHKGTDFQANHNR